MGDQKSTTFSAKCKILSDLWIRYRNEETLEDFFNYNDISLPLAFLLDENIISEKNSAIESFIEETFMLFLKAVEMDDEGFEELDEILGLGIE
jgi:hypothetical protein